MWQMKLSRKNAKGGLIFLGVRNFPNVKQRTIFLEDSEKGNPEKSIGQGK